MSAAARTLPSNRRIASSNDDAPANVRVAREPSDAKPWDPDLLWRRLRVVARVVLAIAVLGAGVFAAIAARRYVTTSPRFGLRDLKITGNHRRSNDDIARVAQIALGQNVVEIDLEAARARLEADPWIERATLARKLPASISIDVVEREAAAIVALPSGVYLATATGEPFKKVELGDPDDLPVVTGISEEDAGGDREATSQLVRRALDLSEEIERVALYGGRVQELNVDRDGGLTAVMTSASHRVVRVVFGRPPYRAKVRLGLKVESELARRNARPTVIFLDDEAHPDRIVVRLVSALPPAQVVVDDGPTPPAAKKGGT